MCEKIVKNLKYVTKTTYRPYIDNLFLVACHMQGLEHGLYLDSSQSMDIPCPVQGPGVPGLPGKVPVFYMIFQVESRFIPGAFWLGFPAKSSNFTLTWSPGKILVKYLDPTWSPCGTGGGV